MTTNEIIAVRKSLGLTQADFARLFDAHVMTISKWERGVGMPTPYQVALMGQFQRKAAAAEEQARTEVKNLLITAGVLGALMWLLSQSKK